MAKFVKTNFFGKRLREKKGSLKIFNNEFYQKLKINVFCLSFLYKILFAPF